MRAVIIANGELTPSARLRELWQGADLRIAADGGARNAREQLGEPPQVVIGDLDSMDAATRVWLTERGTEIIRYPTAKDETDLELALNLAHARGASELCLLGANGGRVDHWLANVMLLTRYPRLRLADAHSEMWLGGGDEALTGNAGDLVSLIPLDARVEGVETEGLQYPLRRETLERGSTRGISNVMQGERARVRWVSGTLVLVHLSAT